MTGLPTPACARLTLAPACARGWLGGRSLVATAPLEQRADVTLAEAADALQSAFDSEEPGGLTAVLARYDGTCTLVRFGSVAYGADPSAPAPLAVAHALLADAAWDMSGRRFRAAVASARERIAAGDVYVLNLTARLGGELATAGPAEAFATLQSRAGADMAALLEGWPGTTRWLASVSPERFVRMRREGRSADAPVSVEVCPIKGTRPRGATPDADADAALAVALAADEKERAEHVMVVDLERNDLAQSCMHGSVHVDPLYEVVTTPYCHQLVSTVRGTLRHDATVRDVLAGAFPCGSVTGAPKRAAMRIISELEASARGAYCGALLVAVPGELDSSVLIRTLEADPAEPTRAVWGAGCGVTHDSDPAAEHLEMLLKSSPVLGDAAPPVALRETMRVVHGRVPLLDRHLTRLASGGAGPSVLARVRAAVAEQLVAADPGAPVLRLGVTVTPDGAVAAGLSDAPSSLAVASGVSFELVTADEPPHLPPAAAKPAARRYWDRAHHRAELAGADQALLVSDGGVLLDGSTANVWLVDETGALLTPPAPPAVAGVSRELIFDLAGQRGIPAFERPLSLADLDGAREVFFANAYGGVAPVRGRGGAISELLDQLVEDAFAGR